MKRGKKYISNDSSHTSKSFNTRQNEHRNVCLKTTIMILCDAQKPVWDTTFGVILGDQMIS